MQSGIDRLFWQSSFYTLMSGCFYFITYKWYLFGFRISILNGIILVESFELMMNKIGQMFGKTETEDE